jgi:hypothetical protein
MNFNSCYSRILEHLSVKLSIPTDTYTPQVWLFSNNGWPGDTDKELIALLNEYNTNWVLNNWSEGFDNKYKFDYECDSIEDVLYTIENDLYAYDIDIAVHYGYKLETAVKEFKQRVTNNPIGYYKLFGNYEDDDIFIAYIYLPPSKLDAAKSVVEDDTEDDISNW